MNDLYKGYIKTKNKKCVEKFKDRTDFKPLDRGSISFSGTRSFTSARHIHALP